MNNFQSILAFTVLIMIILMMFPKRGSIAIKNIVILLKAVPLNKLFEVIGKYIIVTKR